MKQFTLFALILIALQAKAQKVDTLHLPTRVAKQVAVELLKCDSIKSDNALLKQEIALTQLESRHKDSLLVVSNARIFDLNRKVTIQRDLATGYNTMYQAANDQYSQLAKELRRVRGNKTAIEIAAITVIGTLTYLLIRK